MPRCATGVPSITSNLAGFGGFIEEHVPNHEQSGLFVIDRKFVGGDESINQLTQVMFDFCMVCQREARVGPLAH
jgi:glycogen(starch) synthase